MTTKEQFLLWKDFIPDYLHYFFLEEPDLTKKLEYSIGSLDVLEFYIIEKFKDSEILKQKENHIWHERFSMYIGEVFVRNIEDAEWDIELRPKFIYYNLPIIKRTSISGVILCPHHLITTAIDRKTGVFIRTRLEKIKEFNLKKHK